MPINKSMMKTMQKEYGKEKAQEGYLIKNTAE